MQLHAQRRHKGIVKIQAFGIFFDKITFQLGEMYIYLISTSEGI